MNFSNRVAKILEEYKQEELIVNAASRVSQKYHIEMARKCTNYYKLLVTGNKINTIVFGQDPFKNDYCDEIGSAFSYKQTGKSAPYSCKVLAKALSYQTNNFSEQEYLDKLAENHKLYINGIYFLDIFPFPAVKTLLKVRNRITLSKLQQLQTKYGKKLAFLFCDYIKTLKVSSSVNIFLLGKRTKQLFPLFYDKLVNHVTIQQYYTPHPAYNRWKKDILLQPEYKITFVALSNIIMFNYNIENIEKVEQISSISSIFKLVSKFIFLKV